MDSFVDLDRLREQNAVLLRRLHNTQSELQYSVHSRRHKAPRSTLFDSGYQGPPTTSMNINPVHITSTPKHLPLSTSHSSPKHRARTEILDTDPQELLSDSVVTSNYSHSLHLGPRQDDSFFRRPARSPKKKSPRKKAMHAASRQRVKGDSNIGYKTRRRSPRNVSFVNAPNRTMGPAEKMGKGKHRVLNENVQRGRTGVMKRRPQSAFTPSPNKTMAKTRRSHVKRPESHSVSTQSHTQRRYNMQRPNTATPRFSPLKNLIDHTPSNAPEKYQSQFLNSYYANEDEGNEEDIIVQKTSFPSHLLDGGNVRTPRNARRVVDTTPRNTRRVVLDTTPRNARLVLDTTPKPKSILLTPANRSAKNCRNNHRVSFRDSPNTSSATMMRDDLDTSHVQPLLGYDWIAGVLDTNAASEKTEGYLAELQEFRNNNYEECVHKSFIDSHDSVLNASQRSFQEPDVTERSHKCIHNYTLNNRLFPVPLHGNETGESLCAICEARRKVDSATASPSYIRVSVPRSTLRSPYQVRPHRRKSFDPTDSVGLSQHCLAGWENSIPSMMPTASNIDLKDSLGYSISQSQSLFMDREDTTGQPTRARRPLVPSDDTQRLLNRSRSLRLDLQKLERAGLSRAKTAADVLQYPML